MTTKDTAEAAQTTSDAPSGDDKPDDAKGLRKQLNEAHKEINDLNTKVLAPAYDKLGLDTKSGLGKAIAKEYKGEASFDALAKFASDEYGHVAPENSGDHPDATAIAAGQAQLDAAGNVSGSIAPTDQLTDLAKAEAEGDWATAMRIKADQVVALK